MPSAIGALLLWVLASATRASGSELPAQPRFADDSAGGGVCVVEVLGDRLRRLAGREVLPVHVCGLLKKVVGQPVVLMALRPAPVLRCDLCARLPNLFD